MSWIPEFELGIWNAWIPMMVVYPLASPIILAIDKLFGTGEIFKKLGEGPPNQAAKKVYGFYLLLLIILLAYSIFLPLQLGTAWFVAGLVIYLIGLAIFFAAIIAAARSPLGRIFTGGIYRFSRNPGYLATLMMIAGVGVASASWLFLLIGSVLAFMQISYAKIEEQECLDKFGSAYQDYMDRTPLWLGLPKSS